MSKSPSKPNLTQSKSLKAQAKRPPLGALELLNQEIIDCNRCPRLRRHCKEIAKEKRRSFQDWDYWGRPISGFGDPNPKVLVVGLAPAAHGANRTGRIFTGDRSGDWLYRALHRAGFANQPTSIDVKDGLKLKDLYVSCSVRCAPPNNKPSPEEFDACSEFLAREIQIFSQVKVYIALGSLGLNVLERQLRAAGIYTGKKMKFSHGGEFKLSGGRQLLTSYHPSQQNTFTGRLTDPMFQAVFDRARALL